MKSQNMPTSVLRSSADGCQTACALSI